MPEPSKERRGPFWGWYVVAGVLMVAGELTRRLVHPGYGYALIVAGLVLWIVYVLLDGFSPIGKRKKRQDWDRADRAEVVTAPSDIQSRETGVGDNDRPTLRRRLISGLLMACIFGGAKWSDVPSADGVFWAVVALGFAIGWSGYWL